MPTGVPQPFISCGFRSMTTKWLHFKRQIRRSFSELDICITPIWRAFRNPSALRWPGILPDPCILVSIV